MSIPYYIFSASPLLRRHIEMFRMSRKPRGAVVCVNKARQYFVHYDWWVSGDACRPGAPESYPEGHMRHGICSLRPPTPQMARAGEGFGRYVSWDELGIDPCSYSVCAALYLARHLKAGSIAVYGHTMEGNIYCDGSTSPDLNSARWEAERTAWDRAREEVLNSGIPIDWVRA